MLILQSIALGVAHTSNLRAESYSVSGAIPIQIGLLHSSVVVANVQYVFSV